MSRLRHWGLLLISMIMPAPMPDSQSRVHCLSIRPEDFFCVDSLSQVLLPSLKTEKDALTPTNNSIDEILVM